MKRIVVSICPQAANHADAPYHLPDFSYPGIENVCSNENRLIGPGERLRISTGWSVAVPVGYEMQISHRKELSRRGIYVEFTRVAPTDRGDVGVIMKNSTPDPYQVKRGDMIALASQCETPEFKCPSVDSLDEMLMEC